MKQGRASSALPCTPRHGHRLCVLLAGSTPTHLSTTHSITLPAPPALVPDCTHPRSHPRHVRRDEGALRRGVPTAGGLPGLDRGSGWPPAHHLRGRCPRCPAHLHTVLRVGGLRAWPRRSECWQMPVLCRGFGPCVCHPGTEAQRLRVTWCGWKGSFGAKRMVPLLPLFNTGWGWAFAAGLISYGPLQCAHQPASVRRFSTVGPDAASCLLMRCSVVFFAGAPPPPPGSGWHQPQRLVVLVHRAGLCRRVQVVWVLGPPRLHVVSADVGGGWGMCV